MQAQVTTDMVPGEACDALVRNAADADQCPVYRLALSSYQIADAMLLAREVRQSIPTRFCEPVIIEPNVQSAAASGTQD